MKICTETYSLTREHTWEETCILLREAGFDGVDVSLYENWGTALLNSPDYLQQAAALKRTADKNGLEFLQAHAPYGHRWDDEEAVARVIRAIEVCGVVGAPVLVAHPCFLVERVMDEYRKEYLDINEEYYNRLRPYAEAAEVTLAIENMFVWDGEKQTIVPSMFCTVDEIREMLERLDGPFTMCLDTGHTNLNGRETAAQMSRSLGADALGALHIHDNDGQWDQHTLPLTQKMDFQEIFTALHDIGYRGHFTYEAFGFLCRLPKAAYPAATRLMADLAKDWIQTYEL